MLNIPRTIEDPSYRYQMPKMDLKQESRLNGVKTNIFNLDRVAEALRVPGDFIIKYMWAELGVAKEKKSIIKGKHSYDDLLTVLDSFISKFILCPKCNIPETSLFAEKKILKCLWRSCGKVYKLDNSHKVVSYIIRNIPKNMSEIKVEINVENDNKPGKAEGKKNKKNKKDKKPKKESDEEKEEVSDDDGTNGKIPQTDKKDTTHEVLTHESEHVLQAIESIKNFIQEKGDSLIIDKLIQEIHNNWVSIGATLDLKYYIAFNALFTINILKEFEKYKGIFKTYLTSDGEEGIRNFLMVTVRFFLEKYPKLEIAIPTFLHNLYDSDVIEESIYTKWETKKFKTNKKSWLYNRKLEKTFKKKAEEFFKWLREAEEAESEEEEEENDKEETKKELTEEELKAKKMKDLIEKEKQQQEKELKENKVKAEEKKIQQETEKSCPTTETSKIDVMAVKVEDEDVNIDDI